MPRKSKLAQPMKMPKMPKMPGMRLATKDVGLGSAPKPGKTKAPRPQRQSATMPAADRGIYRPKRPRKLKPVVI